MELDIHLGAKAEAHIESIKFTLSNSDLEGQSLEEIGIALNIEIPQRTLQRRLNEMQQLGIVKYSGKGRSTRYYLIETELQEDRESYQFKTAIPLSKEGKKILRDISQPVGQRKRVGYNRQFLDQYEPNKTSYLSTEDTNKLLEISDTPNANVFAGTYTVELMKRLLIDLSYNSSRLEGNTYSLLDTARLIELGQASEVKSALETQMILNHKEAIDFIVRTEEIGFNRYTITNLHAILSNNLLADREAEGRLRSFAVGIGKSVYMPPSIPQLIEELFEQILEKSSQIINPFEQAFFMMVHLPYLQPFADVNKRVSRLAANIPLSRNNLAPLSFVDVPKDLYTRGMLGIYELNRIELLKDVFQWAYERSSGHYGFVRQTLGEPDLFRLKHHLAIRSLITEIISNALDQKKSDDFITKYSINVPTKERAKFIEVVETELLSLHEGKFARYLVSPSEFENWKRVWGRK
jgi:Fic/DOC family